MRTGNATALRAGIAGAAVGAMSGFWFWTVALAIIGALAGGGSAPQEKCQ